MIAFDHILIDGKNTLYRSIFAGHADQTFRSSGNDYFVVFMRFLLSYINRFKPNSAHVFWDAPLDTLWRKQIFPAYKTQRSDIHQGHDFDVKSELKRQMAIAIQVLSNLNIRQYYQDGQEADDLIYAFVYTNPTKKILIISSDGDMKQIIFRFPNVKLLNPSISKSDFEHIPEQDPILAKTLAGDTSDNIPGYYGIGKTKVKPLIEDMAARQSFINSDKALISEKGQRKYVGKELFILNRRLIDLGLSPNLSNNIQHIETNQTKSISFNLQNVELLAQKYKIYGLMANTNNLLPLKHLT